MSTLKSQQRTAKVEALLDDLLDPYHRLYASMHEAERAFVATPDEVREALKVSVAKTGEIRWKKAKPPMFPKGSTVPSTAWLLWTLKEHTGYGAYLPIDGLMMARMYFDDEVYKRWDRTTNLMYHLAKPVNT